MSRVCEVRVLGSVGTCRDWLGCAHVFMRLAVRVFALFPRPQVQVSKNASFVAGKQGASDKTAVAWALVALALFGGRSLKLPKV